VPKGGVESASEGTRENARGKARAKGEYINKGVGVMRDSKLKLEDLKASHTLGGAGEGNT
jgi:hypothetical protein